MPTVVEKTDDSITVSWVPTNSQVSYELFWDAGVQDDDLQLLVTTQESTFTLSDLESGRTYSFSVRALSDCGTSPFSPSLEVGLSTLPARMVPLTTEVSGCDIQINWLKPDDGGSPILDYRLQIRNSRNIFVTLTAGTCIDIDAESTSCVASMIDL